MRNQFIKNNVRRTLKYYKAIKRKKRNKNVQEEREKEKLERLYGGAGGAHYPDEAHIFRRRSQQARPT